MPTSFALTVRVDGSWILKKELEKLPIAQQPRIER